MKFLIVKISFLSFFWQAAHADLALNDLKLKNEEVKVESPETRVMEVRYSKLLTHQHLGLATMVAMTATSFTGGGAKSSNTHKYLGLASGLLYWTTGYMAWSAPRPEDIKDSKSTQIHRKLAWVHVPLMTLAPVLGYLAKEDADKGKKSTGIVKAHGGISKAAFAAFMAAGLTMYIDF